MKGYPRVSASYETNLESIYCIGDLAGSALLKLAIRDSEELINHLKEKSANMSSFSVGIIGGGIGGISCAYYCQKQNISFTIFEKTTPLNTIRNFSEEKRIFMEPQHIVVDFPLEFRDCSKEELLDEMELIIRDFKLKSNLIQDEIISVNVGISQKVELKSENEMYRFDAVILAMGVQGNPVSLPPKLSSPHVFYESNQIDHYLKRDSSKHLIILGGGDTALENAIRFHPHYKVTLIYRGSAFFRPNKKNIKKIHLLNETGKIRVILEGEMIGIEDSLAIVKNKGLKEEILIHDAILVNYGKKPPKKWLKRNNIRIDLAWDRTRIMQTLPIAFVLLVALAFKYSFNLEPFWTIAYTLFVDWYGVRVIRKYKTKFIRIRTLLTMISQTFLLCIIPMAFNDGNLYGLTLTWPLNMYILLQYPNTFFLIYTLVFSLVVIPILTIIFGKGFYCSVLCGCGALAETAGDQFRKYSPQGRKAEKFNPVIYVIFIWAIFVTIFWFADRDKIWGAQRQFDLYTAVVDIFLGGYIGLGLYSIWGNRIWCRYFCPLAAWMNLWGKLSRYRIDVREDRCIKCEKCNESCDMGIDVMKFASQGIPISNKNSFCVACGLCAEVCPTNVLSYSIKKKKSL